jgi:sulfide:quinone oxidoreductase
MQDYKTITSKFSVAGALVPGDIAKFAEIGFRTIVSNLPDEEVTNGFTSILAKAEADKHGMRYIHMPANGATVTDMDVIDQFANVLADADQPIIAHCKTGTRSAILYGLVAARTTRPAVVLELLDDIGFDLDFLEEEFDDQWEIGANAITDMPAAA